jgi:hypothetical protein
VLATKVSDVFALRYALLIVGAVQLLSIPVARSILQGCIDLARPRPKGSPAEVLESGSLPAGELL